MEDGSDGLKNGEVTAKLPETNEPDEASVKINGNTKPTNDNAKSDESDDSSDYDALVIDESAVTKKKRKRKKGGFRGFKNTEEDFVHGNPYFKESIFELFEKSQDKKKDSKTEKKGKANPKLREYTQYLGLQPTVQFKCKKCLRSGFLSLGALNDHILRCNETVDPISNLTSTNNILGQTNIRVTRNVFLCSACGTYYENWNLFLHMREVHRRYICLYCLGMFSHPEKLSTHIVSKHNCVPNRISTLEEFYNIYKVPCFLMCCECQKGFTESDNFFEHQCLEGNSNKSTGKSLIKNPKNSRTVAHVTGDSSLINSTGLESDNLIGNLGENLTENFGEKLTENLGENFTENLGENLTENLGENLTENLANLRENLGGKLGNEIRNENDLRNDNLNAIDNLVSPDLRHLDLRNPDLKSSNLRNPDLKSSNLRNPDLKSSNLKESNSIQKEFKTTVTEEYQSPNRNLADTKEFDTSRPVLTRENSLIESDRISNSGDLNPLDKSPRSNTMENENSKGDIDDPDGLIETRKVPKVTLRLPKSFEYQEREDNYESEDSEKLTMEVDQIENESLESNLNLEMENGQKSHFSSLPYNEENCVQNKRVRNEQFQNEPFQNEPFQNDPFQNESFPNKQVQNERFQNEQVRFEQFQNEPFPNKQVQNEPFPNKQFQNEPFPNKQVQNEQVRFEQFQNELVQNQTEEVQIQIAGPDIPIVELELEQPLDKFDIKALLQKCLRLTIPTCVYCNHARKILVNGKQLGLHAIAEHRFSAVVNSITAEELIPESFVARIKDSLTELENEYFNLESNSSEAITFSHVFECFQCRYSTTIHKELYLHNRKMHAKSILLCIMCKSNFYSYSELICHLCPGLYDLNSDIRFRCCMCVSDVLPSAFRLMVHLRKKHHACDVCLEFCHNQSKLSNHVWKHKLHHLCYRCGIAYRNKPDITKHLFWKHGTESVLCKKCLQKKWPHVYHFCIPPLSFICEECNLSFSKAVYLMVHKRLHTDDKPHVCTEENCNERFISKKLLLKHEFKHRQPEEEPQPPAETEKTLNTSEVSQTETENPEHTESAIESTEIEEKEKPKPKVDVYDLPELNLSESDSSEDENDVKSRDTVINSTENTEIDDSDQKKHEEKPPVILETIWDDFRNYQAIKDKQDEKFDLDQYGSSSNKVFGQFPLEDEVKDKINLEVILNDHDYCVVMEKPQEACESQEACETEMSADHDYCTVDNAQESSVKSPSKKKSDGSPKKKRDGSSSSNSSSDSDSSSCTCGSNCSCSSSSGSSSSSSDSSESDSSSSEGRRRQEARRERRKLKANKKTESESAPVDVVNDNQKEAPVIPDVIPIQESDLETTESDTDEDFYDKQPQELANKLLAEKKNQLLQTSSTGEIVNGSIMDGSRATTPNLIEEPKKKKSKSKKKKKKNKSSKYEMENPNSTVSNSFSNSYQPVAPLTLNISRNSPMITTNYIPPDPPPISGHFPEIDTNLRASKRKRIPNKFYGYSSDEEQEKLHPPVPKWKKIDVPTVPKSPMVVPPITIKTTSIPEPSRTINDFARQRQVKSSFRSTVNESFQSQISEPFRESKSKKLPEHESASDSNDTSSDDEPSLPTPAAPAPPALTQPQPALYCYCRCPYDEVSEMIGCDSSDCAIEWFHFECVGIMVPPKGQWFCPDCRKKKQQRKELMQGHII